MTEAVENTVSNEGSLPPLRRSAVKIGKLGSVYVVGLLVPRAVRVLSLPVFTHYLSPEQWGIVSLAIRVAAPMLVLVQLGLWSGLKMQYFRSEESLRPQLTRSVLLGQIIQGMVICILFSIAGIWWAGPLLPNLPLSPQYVYALWLMIVWGCFWAALVELTTGVMQLRERAKASVAISVSRSLLQITLGIMAVAWWGWMGFGHQGAAFIGVFAVGCFSVVFLWRNSAGTFHKAAFGPVWRSGLTFVPHAFSGLLALSLNAWLLNSLVSPAAMGIYSVAIMFPQLIQIPIVSLSHATYPTLARLMADGSSEAKRQQSRVYTLLITAVAALALCVWLFGPLAVRLLANAKFHEATQVVPILTVAWFFLGLYLIVSQPVFYFGGGLWLSTATLTSIVVSVVLSVLLIPPWGMYGAAWAMVGCYATRLMVAAAVGYYLYPLPWQVGPILRIFGCTAALVATSYWISGVVPFGWAILINVPLLLTMLPLLWITGILSSREIRRGTEYLVRKLSG